MGEFRSTIGDAVLQQFTREWEALSQQLHRLELQKSIAAGGHKDTSAMNAIERLAEKLEGTFDRERDALRRLFSEDWSSNVAMQRLKRVMQDVAELFAKIYKLGRPNDGDGLLSASVQDAQKMLNALDRIEFQASTALSKQHVLTAPGLPPAASSNPMLAIAILLDLIFRLILGRRK